jgi:hypothetical protein
VSLRWPRRQGHASVGGSDAAGASVRAASRDVSLRVRSCHSLCAAAHPLRAPQGPRSRCVSLSFCFRKTFDTQKSLGRSRGRGTFSCLFRFTAWRRATRVSTLRATTRASCPLSCTASSSPTLVSAKRGVFSNRRSWGCLSRATWPRFTRTQKTFPAPEFVSANWSSGIASFTTTGPTRPPTARRVIITLCHSFFLKNICSQVLRHDDAESHSFWIVARDDKSGKSVASFHYVCGSEEREAAMRTVVRTARVVEDLIAIDESVIGPVVRRLRM